MYGEHFDIPELDTVVFASWFEGGEVFRSGCCYHRSEGKVFYFRPGHETYPIYHQEEVLRVIANACRWAATLARGAKKANTKVRTRESVSRKRRRRLLTLHLAIRMTLMLLKARFPDLDAKLC